MQEISLLYYYMVHCSIGFWKVFLFVRKWNGKFYPIETHLLFLGGHQQKIKQAIRGIFSSSNFDILIDFLDELTFL